MLCKNEVSNTMKILPLDFQPSDNDVILGRGRKIYAHAGNVRLRRLVSSCMREYSGTGNKFLKSYIIQQVMNRVRSSSPTGGLYVKRDPEDGRWYDVGDFLAREKTSQTFRDAICQHYKSSNTAKKLRRWHTNKPLQPFPMKAFSSMNDMRHARPSMMSLMFEATVSDGTRSCFEFGQDFDGMISAGASTRNFQWNSSCTPELSNERTEAWPPASERSCSHTNPIPVLDACNTTLPNGPYTLVASYNVGALTSHFIKQPSWQPPAASSASVVSVDSHALAVTEQHEAGMRQHEDENQALLYDLFDRLAELVGSFGADGDPFEPLPI
jgi:hypothetical protein